MIKLQQGYYSNRIKELEKRKEEVTAQVVTSKLTLKGINKEIQSCYEYMNSAHYEADSSKIDSKLNEYEHKVLSLENTVKKMNNTINKKNGMIKSLNAVIDDKDHEIATLKLKHHIEEAKLQEKIAELNIQFKKLKPEKTAVENDSLKKQNMNFKRDIKALNERIAMMDKTIEKKNREIQILHQRLNWQPVKPKTNIFDEVRSDAE